MAAMAHVKLPSSEVVKLTRESGSPLALAMGRCQLKFMSRGIDHEFWLMAIARLTKDSLSFLKGSGSNGT